MLIDMFKDGIGYVTDEVSIVKTCEANACEANRVKFVTDLAAVSRGNKESKNPESRYRKLLKEASPTEMSVNKYRTEYKKWLNGKLSSRPVMEGSPSRPLEFLPVVLRVVYDHADSEYDVLLYNTDYDNPLFVIGLCYEEFSNKLMKYSYIKNSKLYTNMRACINAGILYDNIPYNSKEELSAFKAIKANIPMFIWAQVPNTHTAISKEAQSDRVVSVNDYWLPKDIIYRMDVWSSRKKDHAINPDIELFLNKVVSDFKKLITANDLNDIKLISFKHDKIVEPLLNGIFSQSAVQDIFKELGYHMEIYSRAMYYFKYKEVVMTGWDIDPNVWQHLFIERSTVPDICKNWTQQETKEVVKAIKNIVNEEYLS